MAERVNYYEHDDLKYSNRRSSTKKIYHNTYDESIVTSEPTEYVEHLTHNTASSSHVAVSTQRLSRAEKIYLTIIGALVIGLTIWNLVIQYNDSRLADATVEYQAKTTEIQKQTDLILSDLAAKYDYNTIKQIANENGMILQKTQVRNVGE